MMVLRAFEGGNGICQLPKVTIAAVYLLLFGIEKMFSDSQSPDDGTLNLFSSQTAVLSFPVFDDNQMSIVIVG